MSIRFVEVTTTTGEQLYLNPMYIVEIKVNVHSPSKATLITMEDGSIKTVKETPYEIVSQLEGDYRPQPRKV